MFICMHICMYIYVYTDIESDSSDEDGVDEKVMPVKAGFVQRLRAVFSTQKALEKPGKSHRKRRGKHAEEAGEGDSLPADDNIKSAEDGGEGVGGTSTNDNGGNVNTNRKEAEKLGFLEQAQSNFKAFTKRFTTETKKKEDDTGEMMPDLSYTYVCVNSYIYMYVIYTYI